MEPVLTEIEPLRGGSPVEYERNRFQLAGRWELEVKRKADCEALRPLDPANPGTLLLAKKTRSSHFCRLLYPLELPAARFSRILISYEFAGTDEAFLEWGAVLEQRSDGRRRFCVKAKTEFDGATIAHARTSETTAPSLFAVLGTMRKRSLLARKELVFGLGVIRIQPQDVLGKSGLFLAFQCGPASGSIEIRNLRIEIADESHTSVRSGRAPLHQASAAAHSTLVKQGQDPAGLQAEVLTEIEKLSSALPTPYYQRLSGLASRTGNLFFLNEIARTLQSVDLARDSAKDRPQNSFVSVVMPVHERETLVGSAIQSVLAQSHRNFELLICDDGSRDGTLRMLHSFDDRRIQVFRHHSRNGAASARNTCLRAAKGEYIAYLDSDNLWHPHYLEMMVSELSHWPGSGAAYASYFDIELGKDGLAFTRAVKLKDFHLEDQIEVPYIDLSSFVHRRQLLEVFGYFDERLNRRQDYDLICRLCWISEPRHVPYALNVYQRISGVPQITQSLPERSSVQIVDEKITDHYRRGIPTQGPTWLKSISVVCSDRESGKSAKAFAIAQGLSKCFDVQLIVFDTLEERLCGPRADCSFGCEVRHYESCDFPRFFETLGRAATEIRGDLIYAAEPGLHSLGPALLANHRLGTPIFLETDTPGGAEAPLKMNRPESVGLLGTILRSQDDAKNAYSPIWSQILNECALRLPTIFTDGINSNAHGTRRHHCLRNIKDQSIFDPAKFDRASIRSELGFRPEDRIVLFDDYGNRPKELSDLADLMHRLGDPYKLLVIATPNNSGVQSLAELSGGVLTILHPRSAKQMAAISLAVDLVVFWPDPEAAISQSKTPHRVSDAFAMGCGVIASPIGELARFSDRELSWPVPFGDIEALSGTIPAILADRSELGWRKERARKYFLREFSVRCGARRCRVRRGTD